MNKNHVIGTRRVTRNHYQVVLTNVQSGKCLKVFCDMVRDPEMNDTEFERYCEGVYQGFVNPRPLKTLTIHDPIAETDGQSLLCFKCESLEAQLAQAIDYCDSLQREEAVREATRTANDIEQTADIRTAAEALVAALTKEPDDSDGLVYYEYSKELTNLQAALSRGWLARQEDARR